MTIRILLFLLCFAPFSLAETSFEVVHKRTLRTDGRGEIRVTDDAIEFHAIKEKNSRSWAFVDVQYFNRIAANEFVLLSYEDAALQFGRDRRFRFMITAGELSEQELERIAGEIGKPISNREFSAPSKSSYEVPVKHLHRLGGCEGTLFFSDSKVFYKTDDKHHAREWLTERDVDSIWSAEPYALEIHAREAGVRIFRFQLKSQLDADFYHQLKLSLYEKTSAASRARE